MLTFSLRAFVALFFFFSVSFVSAHNKVVVIPLGGDDIDQCEAITACDGGQVTVSCPSGDSIIACPISKRVFVTSSVHLPDFGGLNEADAICQSLAEGVGMNSSFKAWLSDSSDSPSNRFVQNNGPYVLMDGTRIADDWADLVDGQIDAAIDVNEAGLPVSSNGVVWTGTTSGGLPARGFDGLTQHCTDWTSLEFFNAGVIGNYRSTDKDWSENAPFTCFNQFASFYCFEQ